MIRLQISACQAMMHLEEFVGPRFKEVLSSRLSDLESFDLLLVVLVEHLASSARCRALNCEQTKQCPSSYLHEGQIC